MAKDFRGCLLFVLRSWRPLCIKINNFFFKFQESKELFVCLYKTWSHSQAPIIALVFLAGCYNHALDLVRVISEQEVTIEFLLELDRFVQILESGIFSCKC